MNSPQVKTYTVLEAAKLLRIGKSAAYAAVHRQEIPSLRIGGRLLVLSEPLDRLLQGEQVAQSES